MAVLKAFSCYPLFLWVLTDAPSWHADGTAVVLENEAVRRSFS
jgi:hypothetical protein